MWARILLFVCFAFCLTQGQEVEHGRVQHLCETGHARCNTDSICVPGEGCVKKNATNCACPENDCPYTQECDCQGGCKPRLCSSTRACRRFKSSNLCERPVCSEGHCISEALTCADCNPKTGCPAHSRTAENDATTTTTTKADPKAKGGNINGKDWDDDTDAPQSGWEEPEFPKPLIAPILVLCLCTAASIGSLLYLGRTSRTFGYA